MASRFDFLAVLDYRAILLHGIAVTCVLTVVGGVLGGMVAVLLAWARTQGPGWLKLLVGAYVELIRNTPFLVQLFFIFFGLPASGVRLSEMEAALLAMTLNLGAYGTEIVRAGIGAIERGQLEAALSLAMTRTQVFFHVMLRPALRKVWPALSSQWVIVMLGSAVCSQIAVEDLSFAANFIQGRNFRAFESYLTASALYLVLSIVLRQILRVLGARFVIGRRAA